MPAVPKQLCKENLISLCMKFCNFLSLCGRQMEMSSVAKPSKISQFMKQPFIAASHSFHLLHIDGTASAVWRFSESLQEVAVLGEDGDYS